MIKPYYAYQVFGWIGLNEAITYSGFIENRHGQFRKLWGKVLSGTDEQLIDAVLKADMVYCHFSDSEKRDFIQAFINEGEVESLFIHCIYPKATETTFFHYGLLAGKGKKIPQYGLRKWEGSNG